MLARVLPLARTHRGWTPRRRTFPALFITHGAPPTIDDAPWLDSLFTSLQMNQRPLVTRDRPVHR